MTAGICEVGIENGKVFSGDSSFEIVGGSDEVIGGGGRMVECSALGTNCIVFGSAIANDGEVERINEEVNSNKSSTVNQLVRLKSGVLSNDSVNIHLDVSHGEIGQVSATTCEVEKLNGFEDLGDAVLTVKYSGSVVKTVEDSSDKVQPVEDSGYIVKIVEDSGDVVQTVDVFKPLDSCDVFKPLDSCDVVQTGEDPCDVVQGVVDPGDVVQTVDVFKPVDSYDVVQTVEYSGDVVQAVVDSTVEDSCDVVQAVMDSSDVVQVVEDSGDVVQPVEDSCDVVQTVEDSCVVVHTVVDSGDVVHTVEDSGDVIELVQDLGFANDPIENEDIEVTVVEDEAQLPKIVGEDAKSGEQGKGNPEFIIEDIKFVELDVKSENSNKENVEIIDDNIESQIVVIDGVQNPCNQDADSEVQQLSEIDDNKESNVEDTPNSDDITQLVMAEHEQEIEANNYPITYHTTISQVDINFPDVNDEKQTEEFEVKEAPIPILIFPDSLVSPDITIQFGSFSLHNKDQNQETEHTCNANSNILEIVLDDLQGNISVDKVVRDMDDIVPIFFGEASSEFINLQIEDADSKIHIMEDMIHHEPFGLKDENQFICEIKQSKSYVSNMGIHDETQHALNQKREIEEHLKGSAKEINSLEDNVSKLEPEVADLEVKKTHEENEKEKEVQIPFQSEDKPKSISVFSTVERKKKKTKHTHTDYQIVGKVAGKFNHKIKTKEPVKIIIRDSIYACLNEIQEHEDEEKEKTLVGFDNKSDKLRKEETERKLKEQIQLEKVREKRLRKKEGKKISGNNCSSMNKEIETQETKPTPHLSKQLKPKTFFALAVTLILIFFSYFIN
ncbi:uncharacterized protein LOC111921651 isoform X2 [Lactuca sativa]|uniref:Uncharacterized protein n=2 Tax=Lactuca sativa TaxID=4236 RepID=A0A9R1UFJ9_LACSA|nr:uncharacterized protein LOC111921651 isoform X2 [Lactuca sativa]KAJ0186098.1 hypothetical protein LSAT_V11C900476050 [Lactuca sativa]